MIDLTRIPIAAYITDSQRWKLACDYADRVSELVNDEFRRNIFNIRFMRRYPSLTEDAMDGKWYRKCREQADREFKQLFK